MALGVAVECARQLARLPVVYVNVATEGARGQQLGRDDLEQTGDRAAHSCNTLASAHAPHTNELVLLTRARQPLAAQHSQRQNCARIVVAKLHHTLTSLHAAHACLVARADGQALLVHSLHAREKVERTAAKRAHTRSARQVPHVELTTRQSGHRVAWCQAGRGLDPRVGVDALHADARVQAPHFDVARGRAAGEQIVANA